MFFYSKIFVKGRFWEKCKGFIEISTQFNRYLHIFVDYKGANKDEKANEPILNRGKIRGSHLIRKLGKSADLTKPYGKECLKNPKNTHFCKTFIPRKLKSPIK